MITIITTTDHADRARAELEEQFNVMHNDAAKAWALHKGKAHQAASHHTEDVQKALQEVVRLEALLVEWKTRSCSGSHEECGHMIREDVACLTPCVPHEDACDRHLQDEPRWADSHEEADCCSVHCDGAEHTADAIVVRRAA